MKKLYLIPDRNRMSESLELANQYNAAFEYNDFFVPEVLDNERKIDQIMEFYMKQNRDLSMDTMHGAFLDVIIHSEDRLIREASRYRVRQSMEIAKNLGLRSVIFHTGRLAGFRVKYYLDHWVQSNTEFFQELLDQYPNQEIYMENMFDESSDILAQLAWNMKSEGRFGVCLDYAHATLSKESGENWIASLAPYIRHMHLNDHDLVNDLHLPVGSGRIDWAKMQESLSIHNVDASILLEVTGIEKQKKSIDYLKRQNIIVG